MTPETLIHLAAKSYFMAYIILFCLWFLFAFTEKSARLQEAKIQNGTLGSRQFTDLISLALFILSCYLK